MKSRLQNGMIAGFAATAVVSLLELGKLLLTQATGALTEIRIFPLILAAIAGMRGDYVVGWLIHFAAGTLILGPLFAIVCNKLPTDTMVTKGIAFAVAAFILMSLTVAPMAGLNAFAMAAGFPSFVWLIATHMLFGITLGLVYGRLVTREKHLAATTAAAH